MLFRCRDSSVSNLYTKSFREWAAVEDLDWLLSFPSPDKQADALCGRLEALLGGIPYQLQTTWNRETEEVRAQALAAAARAQSASQEGLFEAAKNLHPYIQRVSEANGQNAFDLAIRSLAPSHHGATGSSLCGAVPQSRCSDLVALADKAITTRMALLHRVLVLAVCLRLTPRYKFAPVSNSVIKQACLVLWKYKASKLLTVRQG